MRQEDRPHRTRTRLLRVVRIFVARIPPAVGNPIADRVGDLMYYTAGKSRRAAISNLRQVMGPVPKNDLKRAVRGVFHNVVRNYYDLFRNPDLSDKRLMRSVEVDEAQWERMEAWCRQGRGVILVSPHFGAFDVMSRVLSQRGLHVRFLVAQIRPAWLSDFFTELRASRGVEPLQVSEEEGSLLNIGALKEGLNILRRGGMLGALADRNMEQRGVHLTFFGRDTVVAAGIAKMALRTGAVVVPSICRRLPRNRYQVLLDEPIEATGSSSNQEDVKVLLSKIFSSFECHIRRNPEQWVLLQRVWPE